VKLRLKCGWNGWFQPQAVEMRLKIFQPCFNRFNRISTETGNFWRSRRASKEVSDGFLRIITSKCKCSYYVWAQPSMQWYLRILTQPRFFLITISIIPLHTTRIFTHLRYHRQTICHAQYQCLHVLCDAQMQTMSWHESAGGRSVNKRALSWGARKKRDEACDRF